MSDEDSPIINKLYSTPESKEKTVSKFKNIIDDIELKLKKPKQNTTNSNLDTKSNTNNKPEKKEENKINNNNNDKQIKKVNSFENGQIKKKTYTKIKNNNSSLLSRVNKAKEKIKEIKEVNFRESRQRNSINAINSINISINSNNDKKKLRTSTPGLRTNEEKNNKKDKKEKDKEKEKEKEKEKKEIIDPLYIPHIVQDPLDVLKDKVNLIIEQSNEDITNLSNKICLIDIEMETAFAKEHENFAKNLEIIYKEKEKKLRETYKKYDFALYKMFKTYGQKNNVIYDEMMKDKVDQILEIEQEFNNKKNKLKNNLSEKIEEIKKIYEKKRQEQDVINNKIINDIKNNIYNILYDKNKNDNINSSNKKEKNVKNNLNNEEGNKKIQKTKSFFAIKK